MTEKLRRVTREDIIKGYKPQFKETQEKKEKEILDHIYNRAGKACAVKGQNHLYNYAKDKI